MRTVKHQNDLPREEVDSPTQVSFMTQLDKVLGQLI